MEYIHPATKAIDDLMEACGGQWPPRPSFKNWPSAWNTYVNIADDMPRKCYEISDAKKFRKWMKDELDERINLPEVMKYLSAHMRMDDPVFLAFLAPLSYLVCFYRCGTVPPTEEERTRLALDFPEKLWKPFNKICDFWGLVKRCNTFGMIVANSLYENPNDPDKPSDLRFHFNFTPEKVSSEKNFYMCFTHIENTFRSALYLMQEYLNETEHAKTSRGHAEKLIDRRIELLKGIRQILVKLGRIFNMYLQEHVVQRKIWSGYVQPLTAWNVNGIEGGASGDEALTFQVMDEFLGTPGKGLIFEGAFEKRRDLPHLYNKILDMLRDHGRDYRFKSFLGHQPEDDPVLKAKDDVVEMLYLWRLGHSKTGRRYLEYSTHTSGGYVDKALKEGEILSERSEMELRLRAQETIVHLQSRTPPKCAIAGSKEKNTTCPVKRVTSL